MECINFWYSLQNLRYYVKFLGDGWNGEDLSIYSRDHVKQGHGGDIFAGGRALQAVLRPYAVRTSGTLLQMNFEIVSRKFVFTFRHDPNIVSAPTLGEKNIFFSKNI